MRVWLFLVPLVFSSCSFTKFAFTSCDMNQECRDAFGWGYVCAEQLCQEVAPIARCNQTYPEDLFSDVDGNRDRIILGVLFDQSQFDVESKAAEFAIDEVMDAGDLGPRGFGAVVCTNEEAAHLDSLSQDQANVLVSEYLADQVGVAAIIGPASSDRVQDVFETVEPFGTLVMSPTATSTSLTPLDGATSTNAEPGLLWRTAPLDDLQAVELATLMLADGMETVAIIAEKGNYGSALGSMVKSTFEEQGGTATFVPYESGADDHLTKISEVEHMGVDGVAFISANKDDTEYFLQKVASSAADIDYVCDNIDMCPFEDGGAGIYLADGGQDLRIFNAVDGIARVLDRIHGTGPAPEPSTVYNVFVDSFDAEFGDGMAESTNFSAYSYDAAWLVLYGAAWAYFNEAAVDGLGIARGLKNVSHSHEATKQVDISRNSWTTVRTEFQAAQPINVKGASGDLDYDASTGEITSAYFAYWCVTEAGGELTFGNVIHPDGGSPRCED